MRVHDFDDNSVVVGQHLSLGNVSSDSIGDMTDGYDDNSLQREPISPTALEKKNSGSKKRPIKIPVNPVIGSIKSNQVIPSELFCLSSDEEIDLDEQNDLEGLDEHILSSYVNDDDENDIDYIVIPGPSDMIMKPDDFIIPEYFDKDSKLRRTKPDDKNDAMKNFSIANELSEKNNQYTSDAAKLKLQKRLKKRGNQNYYYYYYNTPNTQN